MKVRATRDWQGWLTKGKVYEAQESPTGYFIVGDNPQFGTGSFAKSEFLPEVEQEQGPLAVQVGGSHYKTMAMQPWEYINANGMGFAEGSIIKYVSRYKAKNGIEDLEKARHWLDLLIEAERARQ